MLRVENVTHGAILVDRGRVADNIVSRFVGLMGVRRLNAGDGLAIVPCSGVHCFFMAIPIDVLYMSRDHRVIGIDHNLKPWRLGTMHKGVHYVIELPAGTAARTGTTVGDQLRVTY